MGCVSLCWGLDKQASASVPKLPTFRVQDTGLKLSNTLSCDNAKITLKLLIVFSKHPDIVVLFRVKYVHTSDVMLASLVYFVVFLRFSREMLSL